MELTAGEKAMLDGREGKARQKAMELLVRYAQALGAERFVETKNVAGVPGSANPFLQHYYKASIDSAHGEYDVSNLIRPIEIVSQPPLKLSQIDLVNRLRSRHVERVRGCRPHRDAWSHHPDRR